MTTQAVARSYSIKEAAALTGLPASTLRYYEQIGVIAPISRGASSGHRVYDEGDLDQLMWVSCLAATGMSVSDMRLYMANNRLGAEAAADQRRLLEQQQHRLATEAEATGPAPALRRPQDRLLAGRGGGRHRPRRADLRTGTRARRRAPGRHARLP